MTYGSRLCNVYFLPEVILPDGQPLQLRLHVLQAMHNHLFWVYVEELDLYDIKPAMFDQFIPQKQIWARSDGFNFLEELTAESEEEILELCFAAIEQRYGQLW